MSRTIDRILFLQKPEVLEQHRTIVQETISAALPHAEIVYAGSPKDIPDAPIPVIITPTLAWLPQAMSRINGCKWVHFLSAGVEKIWEMSVDWSNISLTKSSGIHGPQMSEFTIGALLHFSKSFDHFVEQSRAREWKRMWLDELTGKTIMILGAGSVGEMIGQRARTFGMRLIAVKRTPAILSWADETYTFEEARKTLGEVAALVVCLPLTPQTFGIVDHDMLEALPKEAILVDISRGGVVVESAVLDLLDRGKLRGAALDVFEHEPLPPTSKLWGRPDVLITPHVSGTSPHYLSRALHVFLDNAQQWQSGAPLTTPVNKLAQY